MIVTAENKKYVKEILDKSENVPQQQLLKEWRTQSGRAELLEDCLQQRMDGLDVPMDTKTKRVKIKRERLGALQLDASKKQRRFEEKKSF